MDPIYKCNPPYPLTILESRVHIIESEMVLLFFSAAFTGTGLQSLWSFVLSVGHCHKKVSIINEHRLEILTMIGHGNESAFKMIIFSLLNNVFRHIITLKEVKAIILNWLGTKIELTKRQI